jgi:GTP-binding protein YchF
LKLALVGLLQSGKSTIFSTISGRDIPLPGSGSAEAVATVPDERLDWLADHYKPKKTTPATISCIDLPGMDFGDEHGRTAARHLLSQIRGVDVLALVVRMFEDAAVPAYAGSVDAARDIGILKTELLLSDLQLVESRIEKLEKQVRKPTPAQAQDRAELELHKKLKRTIEAEKPVSEAVATDAERAMVKSLEFFTLKPIVAAVNVGEDGLEAGAGFCRSVEGLDAAVPVCAKLDHELEQLDGPSRAEFMADLGLAESGKSRFLNSCYRAMGLISFFTVVSSDLRAWCVKSGTTAIEAAGKIHTDIRRGFIRAETFAFEDLRQAGDEKALRAAGKIRLEGKDYVVRDGDIINFRFNV